MKVLSCYVLIASYKINGYMFTEPLFLSDCTLTLIVTAAPRPALHNDTISAPYGSNVTLPCIIDVANPSPSYYWDRVSVEGASSEINKTLSDGSLLLQNVQKSGMYRCTAHNYYGTSIQMIILSKLYC